jgi:glutamine amidotransferase
MIKIIDYGLGNLLAFLNVFRQLGIAASLAKTPADLADASKLILPGVGAFDNAMALLNGSGLRAPLDELVLGQRLPVLGVCVGMQILAAASDEGRATGLGWIAGRVSSFRSLGQDSLMLPHMGWNDVRPTVAGEPAGLFDALPAARFYFLHSYYFQCERAADVAAVTTYGTDFCCAVRSGNIHGVQFHPEKSHHFGARLLRNFAEL